VHPRDRRARRDFERIRMKAKVPDRDNKVCRVDDRNGDRALPGNVYWPRAALREAGEGDGAGDGAQSHHEPFHGCLTTTTAFMNGCGVQWNATSPGCVNV